MKRSTLAITAVAATIAIYAFSINPLLSDKRLEIRERLEARHKTLKKYEIFIKEEGLAEAEFKKAADRLKKIEGGIMQETDVSLSSARLQSKMQDIAENSGMDIASMKTGPHVAYKGYAGIPMEIEGTGTVSALSALLRTLDSAGEFIKIERLDIIAVEAGEGATLRIKIQVLGLTKT
ncbi:MAG: type II secretion system protein GspM [Thermodesulfovibrionales bacterium]|nr:type II secretion system protein GspM [Thermodesulfovibrionales bacterium]